MARDRTPKVPALREDSASDEELMQRYVAGESVAFDCLFRRHAPLVLGLGRRHLGDEDAARDLVQQTFVRLHAARRDYRASDPLRPWLVTIAMNLVRDQWRRRARRPTSSLTHEPVAPEVPGHAERALSRERARGLREALQQLSPGQRRVIELHWLQERPFAEVARIVGSTEGAVRGRAHRAYTRLRELLCELPQT